MHIIKNNVLILLAFLCTGSVLAQDSTAIADTATRWKVGLYRTHKSFWKKEPTENYPFVVSPVYHVKQNKDSVLVAYTYNYVDKSLRRRSQYALFDGKDLYLFINIHMLQKFEGIGRYPYITLHVGREVPMGTDPTILAVRWMDFILAGKNQEVWYFNRKGVFLKATKQAMAFLVRDEKDLYHQLEQEKYFNNDVFRKYLVAMNERYPN